MMPEPPGVSPAESTRQTKSGNAAARVLAAIEQYPVIAAVRDESGLEEAVRSPVGVIFILDAKLINLDRRLEICRQRGKLPLVHLDMVVGLSKDQGGLEYIAAEARPEGIITTKPGLIKPARDAGLATVERIFLIDSLSIQTGVKLARANHPDFLEVMPGIMPGIITNIKREVHVPIIAGGMITAKEQVFQLMKAGVSAVSTSRPELWRA